MLSLAGIVGGECSAALAGGINMMLWHDVTAGICQLQASISDSIP